MKKLLLPLLVVLMAACKTGEADGTYQVVPLPQEIETTDAAPFKLSKSTTIYYTEGNELLQHNAQFLKDYIRNAGSSVNAVEPCAAGERPEDAIILELDTTIANPEGYVITTNENNIVITGKTANGVFYGCQTIRKGMPAKITTLYVNFPAGVVKDEPRFAYRGMHLDVGRHYFDLEFIKEYIDLLALHNMNTFHWHLTEDQGWRLEIKKYPKLTEIGSQRKHTVIGRNTDEYDETPYGGFYTQDEAREIVQYAADRYITVIPELDLPGHMLGALAAYPELGCTGGPYEVEGKWGVFPDVLCLGNDQVFTFLEDVLTEIMDIFPSKYIHIGGDEAPRDRWKECAKCQARIKAEGLKADGQHSAEDRLQTYCMARVEKFLNEHGRSIIGWDEILEGDLAPNATVMSWRGSAGGIKAAQMGHDVIMTPNTHCYFDYYQSADSENEPFGIGGYLPVDVVYSLEPTAQLTEEQAKHIIGVQANLWTEYVATSQHAEYMVLPRMAALAEVQWTQADKKGYKGFTERLVNLMNMYERAGYNYAKHVYNLHAEYKPDAEKNEVLVTMSTIDDAPIYYTLDGTEPTEKSHKYTDPFGIKETSHFRAVAVRNGKKTPVVEKAFGFNLATMRPIEFTGAKPSDRYTFDGASVLNNSTTGDHRYNTGEWVGFEGTDCEVVIDLEGTPEFKRVGVQALANHGDWIMGPSAIIVSVSDDGKTFKEVGKKDIEVQNVVSRNTIDTYQVEFDPVKASYVKILVKASPALPEGHPGAGRAPYLFLDEVAVE